MRVVNILLTFLSNISTLRSGSLCKWCSKYGSCDSCLDFYCKFGVNFMIIVVVTTSISETWHCRELFLFHYTKHEFEMQLDQLHTHIRVSVICCLLSYVTN